MLVYIRKFNFIQNTDNKKNYKLTRLYLSQWIDIMFFRQFYKDLVQNKNGQ